MSADLNFIMATEGEAAVIRELAKVRAATKDANEELKKENKALINLSRDVNRAFTQTLTPLEKLKQQAEKLSNALKNTALPDPDKNKASQALDRINKQIRELEEGSDDAKDAMAEMSRDIEASFRRTLTPLENLREEAQRLEQALDNAELPDPDRNKASQALGRINGKIKDIEESSVKVNSRLTEAFGGAKAQLLGAFVTAAGAAAAAVAGVIRVVVNEMRAAQELADRATATQLSVGASRNVVLRNLDGISDADKQRILQQNQKLAADTGVSEVIINAARADALSSSSGNIGASLIATEIAARFLPDRPSEIGETAGTLLDLMKVTKTDDALVNLGLLSTVGARSRIVDAKSQAKNIAPALIGASELGFSTGGSAALFTSLTTSGVDKTGERTGTAMIQFAKQLEEFTGTAGIAKVKEAESLLNEALDRQSAATDSLADGDTSRARSLADAKQRLEELIAAKKPDRDKIEKQREIVARRERDREREIISQREAKAESDTEVAKARQKLAEEQRAKATEKDISSLNTEQKLLALQQDRGLAEAFFADMSIEAKAFAPIRSLLFDPNSAAAKEFAAARLSIPNQQALRSKGENLLGSFARNNPLEPVAVIDRAINSTLEQQEVMARPAFSSEQITKIQQIMQRAGSSATGARLRTGLQRFADGDATLGYDAGRNLLEGYISDLEDGGEETVFLPSAGPGGPVASRRRVEATPQELEAASLLRQLVEKMEEQTQELERNTQATKDSGGLTSNGT